MNTYQPLLGCDIVRMNGNDVVQAQSTPTDVDMCFEGIEGRVHIRLSITDWNAIAAKRKCHSQKTDYTSVSTNHGQPQDRP